MPSFSLILIILQDDSSFVIRRYSDFIWLLDVLTKRFPFRLLPALPPKKIGPDQAFLDQRKRGLSRFLSFIASHPILKDDNTFNRIFMTYSEVEFTSYRKSNVHVVEEEPPTFITHAEISQTEDNEVMDLPSRLPEGFDGKLDMFLDQLTPMFNESTEMTLFMERMIRYPYS